MNSDGKTPQQKTQQILAITPIIKGQTSSPQHGIPPQQQQLPPQVQTHASPVSAGHGDLIDFSSDPVAQPPASNPTTIQGIPQGLQQPLQPGQPIKRQDTFTSEVDEFVDAKDGEE